MLAERLMEEDAQDVVRAVVSAAKDGDMVAARLVLDRVLPVRKGRPLRLTLPSVATPADLSAAMAMLVAEVAAGRITADEGAAVGALLELQGKTLELNDLARRVAELEAKEYG
jgi:hypothetical protein